MLHWVNRHLIRRPPRRHREIVLALRGSRGEMTALDIAAVTGWPAAILYPDLEALCRTGRVTVRQQKACTKRRRPVCYYYSLNGEVTV